MNSEVKIISLNLWRYNDWEKRFPRIVSLLKELDADIVCFQEVQQDPLFGERNQLSTLNKSLNYPYEYFALSDIRTTRKGAPLPFPVQNGLGILSRFKGSSEVYKLQRQLDGKEQRILVSTKFTVSNVEIVVTNLHFTNSDSGAESHLRETLQYISDKGVSPILLGDFNIKRLDDFESLYSRDYISSSSVSKYVSYPTDNVSYDYLLLPKKFEFLEVKCVDEMVSDHRVLFAKIRLA